jgi:hypothetical protein
MLKALQQSVAATLYVGPILDLDGVAYESAVIGDFQVVKTGTRGSFNGSATATHDVQGHYRITAQTADVDTLGRLTVILNKSAYVMPAKDYQIVTANVFNSLVGGTGYLDVNALSRLITAAATPTISVSRAASPLSIYNGVPVADDPDQDQWVHPAMIRVPGGFANTGYEWWLVGEPYPNGDQRYEQPHLLCSNDRQNWVTPPGVTNPLEPNADGTPEVFTDPVNVDGHLCLGGDGKIHLYYQHILPDWSSTFRHRTYDGATVSAAETLANPMVCPSVWYAAGKYHWMGISSTVRTIYGGAASQLGTRLSTYTIYGCNAANSDGGLLRLKLTTVGGVHTIDLYKNVDGAAENKVATGSRTGNGALYLSAVNTSGLAFASSVTLTYTGDVTDLTTSYIDMRAIVHWTSDTANFATYTEVGRYVEPTFPAATWHDPALLSHTGFTPLGDLIVGTFLVYRYDAVVALWLGTSADDGATWTIQATAFVDGSDIGPTWDAVPYRAHFCFDAPNHGYLVYNGISAGTPWYRGPGEWKFGISEVIMVAGEQKVVDGRTLSEAIQLLAGWALAASQKAIDPADRKAVVDVLADTGMDGVVVAPASKTGYALTSEEQNSIAAALLDLADGVETGVSLRQTLRRMAAVLAGKLSGVGTGRETFKGLDGSTDRIRVTVDAAGNRSAVSYDPAP